MSKDMPPPLNQFFGDQGARPQRGPPQGFLPPDQTKKPMGADRVPMSGENPQRSVAAQRIREANKRGVNPGAIIPGRPQQSAAPPKSAARPPQSPQAPVPAVTLPNPDREINPNPLAPGAVPIPFGRPAGAPTLDPTQRIQGGVESVANQPRPEDNPALARGLQLRGEETMRDPKAPVNQQSFGDMLMRALSNQFGSGADPNKPLPPATSGPSAPQAAPPQQDFPRDAGRQMLIEQLKKNMMPPGQQSSLESGNIPVMAQGGDDEEEGGPRTLVMQAGPPNGTKIQYTPSQQGSVWYDRPVDTGEGKGRKTKADKPAVPTKGKDSAKGNSDNYYYALGVPPGDKTAAAHAFQALQAKARLKPGTITPEEDRILSMSNAPAYNKSMLDDDILKRFHDYGMSQQKIDEAKSGGKVGQTPQSRINERFPGAGPQSTVVYGAKPQPQDGLNPDTAVTMVDKAIDQAGKPVQTPPPYKGGQPKRNYTVKEQAADDEAPVDPTTNEPKSDDEE